MRNLNYAVGPVDNPINFSVDGVTSVTLEEWLEMAGKQYFPELSEEERARELTDIYKACLEIKQEHTPKYEVPVSEVVEQKAIVPAPKARRTVRNKKADDEPTTKSETGP